MTRAALRSRLSGALVLGFLLAPRLALACPVCTGGGKEEVGRAFFVGSLVLSILPLAAVGAGVWWLRRRARALESSDTAPVQASPSWASSLPSPHTKA